VAGADVRGSVVQAGERAGVAGAGERAEHGRRECGGAARQSSGPNVRTGDTVR